MKRLGEAEKPNPPTVVAVVAGALGPENPKGLLEAVVVAAF